MSCLDTNIGELFDETKYRNFWIYTNILIFLGMYYLVISLGNIESIRNLYPPVFTFIQPLVTCFI